MDWADAVGEVCGYSLMLCDRVVSLERVDSRRRIVWVVDESASSLILAASAHVFVIVTRNKIKYTGV